MLKKKFYDLRARKSFTTDKFTLTTKKTKAGTRYFAVTTAPSGVKSYVIVSKSFYMENK